MRPTWMDWERSDTLTFDEFARANLKRCDEAFHPIDSWSPTDWATAVAGEVGEACNLIKKARRTDYKISPSLLHQIGLELADAVTYIDLLCSRLDLCLSDLLVEKFDAVSDRVGSSVRL